jgi:hypothetical protein
MNKLRDKRTGQYVSMKKATEIEPNKIIDIWLKEEPEPDTDRDVFLKGCTAAALIGLTFFLFAWGIYAIGRV